jgi:HK97 family phage major capsid protein
LCSELRRITKGAGPNGEYLAPDEAERIDEINDELMDIERKIGFDPTVPANKHPGFPPSVGSSKSLKDRERLYRKDSVAEWVKATGHVPHDYDVNEAWDAFAKGLIEGNWQPWQANFAAKSVTTSEPGGGYLVPEILSAQVIDRMRSATPIFLAGAQIIPMRASTLDIARITGDPTPAWRSELGAVTASDVSLDRIRFTARSLSFFVRCSRELVEDAPNLGEVVQTAVSGAVGVELTRVALRGSGTPPEPTGIRNASGVNLTALGANGGAVTWDTLLSQVSTLWTNNATPNALIWHPRTAGAIVGTKDTTGQYVPPPGPVADLDKYTTTVRPTNLVKGTSNNTTELYSGDFRQLLIGQRVGLSLEPLRERYADTAEVAFWCWVRADVQLEHGAAFSVITDSTT